jgi:hypothetical protein
MTERQLHGFLYEERVVELKNLTPWSDYIKKYPSQNAEDRTYTSTWDAVDESIHGKNYKGKPVQIKCIKHGGSVDLGDIFRNANKKENFLLIVGFWKNTKDNIVEEYTISVDHQKWNKLFESDIYDEVKDWLKNKVSNDRSYDSVWKIECSYYKERWGKNRIIQPRFKRDHKKQRRIQCGVSYKTFIEYFIKKGIVNE